MEIQILSSLLEEFEVLEECTDTDPGSFKVKLVPNCGQEEAGCSVELRVQYKEEYPDADYEILEATADGLSEEHKAGLQEELECLLGREVESVYDVITGLQDYLGSLNHLTRRVI